MDPSNLTPNPYDDDERRQARAVGETVAAVLLEQRLSVPEVIRRTRIPEGRFRLAMQGLVTLTPDELQAVADVADVDVSVLQP